MTDGALVTKDFWIVDEKLGWLEAQLEKLCLRARKLGVQEPLLVQGNYEDTTVKLPRAGLTREAAELMGPSGFVRAIVRRHHVEIIGTAPRFAGWTFAATLEHLGEAGTIVRSIGETEVPERFRAAGPDCEHCNVHRLRRDTYVVRHDNGQYKQVGSSCIQDFLGHTAPQTLAQQATFLSDVLAAGEAGQEGGGFSTPRAWPLVDFLAAASAVVALEGYISKKQAEADMIQSTADRTLAQFDPRTKSAELVNVNQANRDEAGLAATWAETQEDPSDYAHNIRVIARSGVVTPRQAGYAASIVTAHHRALAKQAEAARGSQAPSRHVGKVGERLAFSVLVQRVRSFDSQWGVSHLHVGIDPEGNVLKWYSGSPTQEGTILKIKGTVKAHDQYNGTAQTVLARVSKAK